MLSSGKKNIRTLVLSEKKILNETKNHNPPHFQINGRSLIDTMILNILERSIRFTVGFVLLDL